MLTLLLASSSYLCAPGPSCTPFTPHQVAVTRSGPAVAMASRYDAPDKSGLAKAAAMAAAALPAAAMATAKGEASKEVASAVAQATGLIGGGVAAVVGAVTMLNAADNFRGSRDSERGYAGPRKTEWRRNNNDFRSRPAAFDRVPMKARGPAMPPQSEWRREGERRRPGRSASAYDAAAEQAWQGRRRSAWPRSDPYGGRVVQPDAGRVVPSGYAPNPASQPSRILGFRNAEDRREDRMMTGRAPGPFGNGLPTWGGMRDDERRERRWREDDALAYQAERRMQAASRMAPSSRPVDDVMRRTGDNFMPGGATGVHSFNQPSSVLRGRSADNRREARGYEGYGPPRQREMAYGRNEMDWGKGGEWRTEEGRRARRDQWGSATPSFKERAPPQMAYDDYNRRGAPPMHMGGGPGMGGGAGMEWDDAWGELKSRMGFGGDEGGPRSEYERIYGMQGEREPPGSVLMDPMSPGAWKESFSRMF